MGKLLDPTRRSACGKAALETAKRWTFEEHYRAMLEVFQLAARKKLAA
jgi:hypothetical protein